MKLYHGGVVPVESPRIIHSEIGRDFGPGFYTTDIREQAERWALRRKRIAMRNGEQEVRAVVSVYDFDMGSARRDLLLCDFPAVTPEWLELVLKCRAGKGFVHSFDIVTGKIANDNVGETVAYVQAGVLRKEDALERLKFQQINNQIAFCSERALRFLQYETHYIVGEV